MCPTGAKTIRNSIQRVWNSFHKSSKQRFMGIATPKIVLSGPGYADFTAP